MDLNLKALCAALQKVTPEETVPSDHVNPYLLNEVLTPLLRGVELRYGDIDFSRFNVDDLRSLAGYCEERDRILYKFGNLFKVLDTAAPAACRQRAFC